MNGDDGVVLVVIQITDDPSAERMAPPRSTHVQPGDVSYALIQQGEKERLMEIQQHDGVVVEVAGFQQGFAKRCGRREMCHGREREAPGLRCGCPPFPPLYIGPRERGGRSLGPSSKEGCGQGGVHPPQGT